MGVLDRFFFIWGRKKWLLVELDRWLSYTITIMWELAWTDSALVLLDKWLSYRGGHITRLDCITSSDLQEGNPKQLGGNRIVLIGYYSPLCATSPPLTIKLASAKIENELIPKCICRFYMA